jgi:hypothetical protein
LREIERAGAQNEPVAMKRIIGVQDRAIEAMLNCRCAEHNNEVSIIEAPCALEQLDGRDVRFESVDGVPQDLRRQSGRPISAHEGQ